MKFDAVIILGPTTGFYPIGSQENPKFALPFLGTPLLNHTLEAIGPYTSKIYIICLRGYENLVKQLTNFYQFDIEIILNDDYCGFFNCINSVKDKISTNCFFLSKGDTFFYESPEIIINEFKQANDDMHVYYRVSSKKEPLMSIDSKGYLKCYAEERIPFIINERIKVTVENELQSFYFCRKTIFENITKDCFSFKKNGIPAIVRSGQSVKLYETENIEIKNLVDYQKQIKYISEDTFSGMITHNFLSCDNRLVQSVNNLFDVDCVVGMHCKLAHSIFLSNVKIGSNCIIENCIVGNDAVICDGCWLVNCNIAPGFVFSRPVSANSVNFPNK